MPGISAEWGGSCDGGSVSDSAGPGARGKNPATGLRGTERLQMRPRRIGGPGAREKNPAAGLRGTERLQMRPRRIG